MAAVHRQYDFRREQEIGETLEVPFKDVFLKVYLLHVRPGQGLHIVGGREMEIYLFLLFALQTLLGLAFIKARTLVLFWRKGNLLFLKDWLEDLVVRETMKLIQDDAVIDKIVQLVMDVQNQENTTMPLLEKQLREVNKKLDNLMKAIEDGLYTRTTKERLEALESQKDELTVKIADEKLKKPSFKEDFIRFWLMKFRKFDISQKKQRKALIEIFVNAIFLYDDRMLITFNYKDGTQTVRFEDTLTADCGEKSLRLRSNESPSGAFEKQNGLAQARWRGRAPTSSDLSSSAGPKAPQTNLFVCGAFLFAHSVVGK